VFRATAHHGVLAYLGIVVTRRDRISISILCTRIMGRHCDVSWIDVHLSPSSFELQGGGDIALDDSRVQWDEFVHVSWALYLIL
jgi:hypothetical protein